MRIKRYTTKKDVIAHINTGGKLSDRECEVFREDLDCIKTAVRRGQTVQISEHILDAELLILILQGRSDVPIDSYKCQKLLSDRKTALEAIPYLSRIQSLPSELLNDVEFMKEADSYFQEKEAQRKCVLTKFEETERLKQINKSQKAKLALMSKLALELEKLDRSRSELQLKLTRMQEETMI